MYISVLHIIECEFLAAGSYVPLLIPVASNHSIDAANEHIAPNIEFPSKIEERAVYVQLNDVSLSLAVIVCLLRLHYILNLIQVIAH